jgi:hypothetical protein
MSGQPYVTVSASCTAIQWAGDNLAEIQDMIGPPNASIINGGLTLLVTEYDREQRAMQPGGWVVLSDDNRIFCVSGHSFDRYYHPAGEGLHTLVLDDTGLQILAQAMERGSPFEDIPELRPQSLIIKATIDRLLQQVRQESAAR